MCDAAFLKFRFGCGVRRVLHLFPIRRYETFVGRVLRARGYRVLEALQGFYGGVGNGEVDVVFRVVPIDGNFAVLAAIWVNSDGVIILESIEEVGGVVGREEFNSKVIYIKVEGGR